MSPDRPAASAIPAGNTPSADHRKIPHHPRRDCQFREGTVPAFFIAFTSAGIPGAMIRASVGTGVVLLVSGTFFFQKTEQYYADVV